MICRKLVNIWSSRPNPWIIFSGLIVWSRSAYNSIRTWHCLSTPPPLAHAKSADFPRISIQAYGNWRKYEICRINMNMVFNLLHLIGLKNILTCMYRFDIGLLLWCWALRGCRRESSEEKTRIWDGNKRTRAALLVQNFFKAKLSSKEWLKQDKMGNVT